MSEEARNAITVLAVLAVIAIAVFIVSRSASELTYQACTQEARLCPDGSYVGRTGPECAFAACPDMPPAGWSTATATSGISFRYPREIAAVYITPVDWPPSVQLAARPFACTEAGEETERAGETRQRVINGRTYCVTVVSEGAAGSVYSMYAYAFAQEGRVPIITFSLRAVQCGNYDEEERQVCEDERARFDIGPTIDLIARTLQIPATP